MDDIDGTGHYERNTDLPVPSLLAIVLDTNPYAWSTLAPSLSLSTAVAELLIFINAHLAFNHANKVAVIASHCGRAAWLYPSPSSRPGPRLGLPHGNNASLPQGEPLLAAPSNPNKYRPFALIEHELLRNLESLFSTSEPADLQASPTSTLLSGALTLALSYINKTQASFSSVAYAPQATLNSDTPRAGYQQSLKMTSRILLVSTSGDLASQYIPIMNLIFAAQHSRIPIDILKLGGDSVLLQQASYTTSGIFLSPTVLPHSKPIEASGREDDSDSYRSRILSEQSKKQKSNVKRISLLPTLLFAFLPDTIAREHLILPTGINVDFRAACFCHRRVVDIGFVCSICLGIFCEEGVTLGIQAESNNTNAGPNHTPGAELRGSGAVTKIKNGGACLTCGTILNLSVLNPYGSARESEIFEQHRVKKKKKRRRDGTETPAT